MKFSSRIATIVAVICALAACSPGDAPTSEVTARPADAPAEQSSTTAEPAGSSSVATTATTPPAGDTTTTTTTTTAGPQPSDAAPTAEDPATTSSVELTVPTFPPATLPTATVAPLNPGSGPSAGQQVPATDVLAGLTVAAEHRGGYDRDLFEHWTDIDGNGCRTRDDVLRDESLQPAQIDPYGCKVLAGLWNSAYDGFSTEDPTELDVDHVVALAEAWDSGAWAWDAPTRERYANDRDDPRSLIAVSASSNRSKSASDHSEWLPQLGRCDFTGAVLAVKARWGLSVDAAEHAAISALLNGECAGLRIDRWPAAVISTAGGPPATVPVTTVAAPPVGDSSVDPRFDSCKAAIAAGYGPYRAGIDIEYGWYRDGDSDGIVCE